MRNTQLFSSTSLRWRSLVMNISKEFDLGNGYFFVLHEIDYYCGNEKFNLTVFFFV